MSCKVLIVRVKNHFPAATDLNGGDLPGHACGPFPEVRDVRWQTRLLEGDGSPAVQKSVRRYGGNRLRQVLQIPGRRDRKDLQVPNQQFRDSDRDRRRPVPLPPAGQAVLQIDQTTPAHQVVLQHLRERGEDPDLDRGGRLRAGRDHPQATRHRRQPLHNYVGAEPDPFRENPAFFSAFERRHPRRRRA